MSDARDALLRAFMDTSGLKKCSFEGRTDAILAALSAAGFVIVPRDGMKVPHDAAAAFWRRFQEVHHAKTGARGFYESFGGGWNALVAMLSAPEGKT